MADCTPLVNYFNRKVLGTRPPKDPSYELKLTVHGVNSESSIVKMKWEGGENGFEAWTKSAPEDDYEFVAKVHIKVPKKAASIIHSDAFSSCVLHDVWSFVKDIDAKEHCLVSPCLGTKAMDNLMRMMNSKHAKEIYRLAAYLYKNDNVDYAVSLIAHWVCSDEAALEFLRCEFWK